MTDKSPSGARAGQRLRSRAWFDDPANPDMTALYVERYTNFGISVEELQSGKPIIGIAQTGSDLTPCNRHHLVLAERLREGIREAGGIALEFPVHPIQETGKRPTPGLDRNLAYLSLVEVLFGYPLDGVVLTIGCDKTTPACLMAAATVNIPAIALSVGPMLNGWHQGKRTGSGTIVWKARDMLAAGEIDYAGFMKLVTSSTRSTGFCNTMGTATTMNSLTEVLGMSLPGSAAIPAPYRERQECAYRTGKQIVEMVAADRKPSDILTRDSFINAIRVNSALGGSTNAPIHLAAIARHIGVQLSIEDWQQFGYDVPLLVNLQPAGEYLGEDFFRAGGVPAVVAELQRYGLIEAGTLTVNGHTLAENCRDAAIEDRDVIRSFDQPLRPNGGFLVLKGNLFDSAIMKTSVISDDFRQRYLSDPKDPEAFEGPVVVFDGPEDYHARIDDPALGLDATNILVVRGTGMIGYPGAPEVVNMRPSAALIRAGVHALPCLGDGRQSGTSGSPSILNASPEAAVGGGLALLKSGDRVRVDLRQGTVNVLIADAELAARRAALEKAGGYPYPASQTPWQEMQRRDVGQLQDGAVLEPATKYQRLAQTVGVPGTVTDAEQARGSLESNDMFIAGDWGTSHLRLSLVDADGGIRAECRGRGAVDVQGGFAAELAALSAEWTARHGALPVVLCGMVGSNFGWTQTRALDCPLDVRQIGRYCSEPVPGVRIVPGLRCRNTYGAPDFLRGEETQILGALTLLGGRAPVRRLLCLPGTHTKWVILEGNEVREFVSVPAGEIYRALHDHTVLVRESQDAPLDREAFAHGLAAFNEHPAAQLLHRLFETRGRQLQGELTAAQAAAFLSGLLIASDVAGGLDLAAAAQIDTAVTLIGAPELTGLYAQSLAGRGQEVREFDGKQAAVAGLRAVYRQSAREDAA